MDLFVYDQKTMKVEQTIEVPIEKMMTKEEKKFKQRILNMRLSRTENYLAILVGHTLVQNEVEANVLIIYKNSFDGWQLDFKRALSHNLRHISSQFEFCIRNKEEEEILFTDCREIVAYNFRNDQIRRVFMFKNFLNA